MIGEVYRKASPGGKVWHPTGLLPSVQAIYNGHSHLTAGQLKSERERPGSIHNLMQSRMSCVISKDWCELSLGFIN